MQYDGIDGWLLALIDGIDGWLLALMMNFYLANQTRYVLDE